MPIIKLSCYCVRCSLSPSYHVIHGVAGCIQLPPVLMKLFNSLWHNAICRQLCGLAPFEVLIIFNKSIKLAIPFCCRESRIIQSKFDLGKMLLSWSLSWSLSWFSPGVCPGLCPGFCSGSVLVSVRSLINRCSFPE